MLKSFEKKDGAGKKKEADGTQEAFEGEIEKFKLLEQKIVRIP
jgi:hypothetical protein